jgi:hypothetical protein
MISAIDGTAGVTADLETAGLELATIKCMMGANPSKARSSALPCRRFEETP